MIIPIRDESILFSHKWQKAHLAWLRVVEDSYTFLKPYGNPDSDYWLDEIRDERRRTEINQLVHKHECPCLEGRYG